MSTTTTTNTAQPVSSSITATTTTTTEENKFIPISHDLADDVKSNHKQRYIMLHLYILSKQFRFFKFKRHKAKRTFTFEITEYN